MQKDICAMYGDDAVTNRTFQRWFAKFHAGDFFLNDAPQLGRPVEVDKTKTLIENNQQYTTWEIANILRVSRSSTENRWHQFGYGSCFDVWAPLK